jgi:alpha-D-xyloside xylohydrolase
METKSAMNAPTGIPMMIRRSLLKLSILALVLCSCGVLFMALPAQAAPRFRRTPNGVTLRGESGVLHVDVCEKNVIHVFFAPNKKFYFPSVPVVTRPCGAVKFQVSSSDSMVRIQTGDLITSINRTTDNVRFLSAKGKLILAEQPNGRKLTPKTIDGANTYQVQQNFELSSQEAIYGLGQRADGTFNVRSMPIQLLQANTNIAIPFLVSTKGYGLLWDNAALTYFNPTTKKIAIDPTNGNGVFHAGRAGEYGFLLKGNLRKQLQLDVCGKSVINIQNMWVPHAAGGKIYLKANTTCQVHAATGGSTQLSVRYPSNTMAFQSQAGNGVNYYFMYGPSLNKVVAEYREETGAVPLLPRWAFGFWQSRERYSSQKQLLQVASEFREKKIPVDVMVQDWQYWGKYGWNAMRFDREYYPHPAQMISELHREHLHFAISVWAKFGNQTQVIHRFQKHHYLLRHNAESAEPGETQGKESWVDMFNPGAQKLFWADMNKRLFKDGADAWWLDASEPEGDPLRTSSTYLGPGIFVRNAYPLYETTAVSEGQRSTDPNKRVAILTRSAFAGQQRVGTISWSGDITGNWLTLRRQIPDALSFSISGFPYWTSDTGGFFRPSDQYTSKAYHQLLIRWFEFSTFSPIFRVHGWESKTAMWNYGPATEHTIVKFDKLRYRLLPYIYSADWDVTSKGRSIINALPFEYPHQLALRNVSHEFLFGKSILVSPVTRKDATSRRVTLPAEDGWTNFWTGQSLRGGRVITAQAPLNQIPVFVKQGSILVLGPVIQSTAQLENPMEIRIYPGRNASFHLYEDTGSGYGYQRGEYSIIPMYWNNRHDTLVIGPRKGSFPGMRKTYTFRIEVVRPGHGVGPNLDRHPDVVLHYSGQRMRVTLPAKG